MAREQKRWVKIETDYLLSHYALMTIQEIANVIGRTYGSVKSKAKRLGVHCKPKQREQTPVNHNFFKSWSSEMAYVLGYWFADGSITSLNPAHTYQFEITSKDYEHLVLLRDLMNSEHSIYDKHDGSHCLVIGSKTIWKDVQYLGGKPAKSLINEFPDVPQRFIRDFIGGYFDGDGSISVRKNGYPRVKFLGTYEFLSVLQGFLPLNTNLYQRHQNDPARGNNQYEIVFSGEEAQVVLGWLYLGAKIFLARKRHLYDIAKGWHRERRKKVGMRYEKTFFAKLS